MAIAPQPPQALCMHNASELCMHNRRSSAGGRSGPALRSRRRRISLRTELRRE